MNFKKIYTEANDEIIGNREILDKILAFDAPKQKFNFKFVIPAVAVCMAVAAVAVVNPFKSEPFGIPTPENSLMAVTPANNARQADEPPAYDGSEEIPEDILPASEPFVANEPDVAPADEPLPERLDGLSINYTEVLAGADASVMSRGISKTVVMLPDEYAEYIGQDVVAVMVIPDDMAVMVPEFIEAEISDENNEIISEKAVYYAHSEDYERFAEVNVSRTQNIEIPKDNLEVSDVCGNDVVVLSDGTDFNASFSLGEVQYFIRTGGITEEELKNLLISLNGGNNYDKEGFDSSTGSDDSSIITGNDGSIG